MAEDRGGQDGGQRQSKTTEDCSYDDPSESRAFPNRLIHFAGFGVLRLLSAHESPAKCIQRVTGAAPRLANLATALERNILSVKLYKRGVLSLTVLATVAGAQAQPASVTSGVPSTEMTIAQAVAGGPSEADVKDFIQRAETRSATGVGSQHKSAVCTFSAVRFGASRPTNAYDRGTNGITGPTVYPVRVTYTSLRTWGNGETETKPIKYDYEFYKDQYGEWAAYRVGPAPN